MKKISINVFLGYLLLIIIAVITSVLGIYIVRKIEKPKSQPTVAITPQLPELPSQYPDYDAIKGKNRDPKIRVVQITKDCPPDGCKNDKPATREFGGIYKKYEVKGKFSRAYLYIEALVDYDRPLTAWDDFYFRINKFGGHIIADKNSLAIPPGEDSKYLYDLRAISYYPTIKDKENRINRQNNINLFVLLQDGATFNAVAAVSSDRPGRVMKEVSIYYECFVESECIIQEVNKNHTYRVNDGGEIRK